MKVTILTRSRTRRGSIVVLAGLLALATGTSVHAAGITAPPPKDCNTPNQTGGTGVLEQPQSINPQTQQPYLTKALSSTVSQPGSTTYQFTLTTTRTTTSTSGSGGTVTYSSTGLTDTSKSGGSAWTTNQWTNATVSANAGAETGTVASNTSNSLTLTAGGWTGGTPSAGSPYVVSFFSELLDCAWDINEGGNSTTAQYATQQNAPTFSGNQLTISLDVNNSDSICDRVELKGTTPTTGTPFTDYSNLVGSPNGTQCTLAAVTPEVPTAVLVLVIGGGAVGAYVYWQRRRSRAEPAV